LKDRHLTIDLGNTRAKAALFDRDGLVSRAENLSDRDILRLAAEIRPDRIALSSVRRGTRRLISRMEILAPVLELRYDTPLPFALDYATPQTLGADRLAAAAGAWGLFPGETCLIVDAGTCITCDILHASKGFLGGAISPGIDMQLRALHKFTSGLPRIAASEPPELIGRSTRACMLSGVVNGTRAGLKGLIEMHRQTFGSIRILICGGQANFFETTLKEAIFAVPDLVLIGLNEILKFNPNP
jgi:type III pantothenate kinase